jgi:type VI protein secretion system component Hcp
MAESDSGAILMAFFTLQNQAIEGESTTSVKAADGVADQQLMTGFAPNKMFEIATFTFSTKLDDDQASTAESEAISKMGTTVDRLGGRVQQLEHQIAQRGAGPGRPGLGGGTGQPSHKLNFARWRASKNDLEFKGRDRRNGYLVNVQPVTFSRQVDKTSFRLMKYFLSGEPFRSAALVKRKPAGTKAAGEAFLRIDFQDVLITNIDWSDDDPVKETVKFISRVIKLQYRPQLPDGSLGDAKQASYAPLLSDRPQ